jgi:hypothetical protein
MRSRLSTSPRLRSALFALLPVILLLAGSPQMRVAIAYLAPFLLLIAILLADRYPGEGMIRFRSGGAVRRRPAPGARPVVSFAARWPRGGQLLAFALAGRAPPAPAQRSGLCSI